MFRFFRKHRWILIVAMAVTAITFVFFMGQGGNRGNGSGGTADFGSVYGHKISMREYMDARNDFNLFYWFHNQEWPVNVPQNDLEEQIYLRLMLLQKAHDLGIHVSDESAGAAAATLLHSLDRNNQHVTLDIFAKQILASRGLGIADFERFARNDIAIQQLIQTLGLSGELITPQEAASLYERQHQEVQAQAVFFSASNYLSHVTVNPGIIGQFYTNQMAYYRLPDRVQVNYVEFELSNYLASAEQKIGKTNLTEAVEANFRKVGLDGVPGAKTEAEAKEKIRESLLKQEAVVEARKEANDFATELDNLSVKQASNLATLAKQKGYTVHLTAPFSAQYGPEEFLATESFVKAAFALTPAEPITGPIPGSTAFYVIAFNKQLPSEVPSLDSIRDRVTADFKMLEARAMAVRDGTNFVHVLTNQLASGKSFAAASVAAGFKTETLPPFSLVTTELTGFSERTQINELKQVAFGTPVGQPSNFAETEDGGFILFVEKKLPIDRATMTSQMPEFTAQLRRNRANEAFNIWLQGEANRELRNTPVVKNQMASQKGAAK